MTGPPQEPLPAPLPINARPAAGESADAYIRRLAIANHMKPSYLRGFLTGSSYDFSGRIRPDRLAAISGRPASTIELVFPGLFTETARPLDAAVRSPRQRADRQRAERQQLFTDIRRDAAAGLSIRAIARRHQVHRYTVRQALDSPVPPARKRPTRAAPANDLVDRYVRIHNLDIDTLSARQLWEQLIDEHDTPVSYATVVHYIRTKRPSGRRPADPGAQPVDFPGAAMPAARELFAAVRKRPGMFGVRSYESACALVLGYDMATDATALAGFREFLIVRHDGGNNLVFQALVRLITIGHVTEPLDAEADASATDGLFELLDQFLALRDQHGGLLRIYDDYLTWLKRQDWYDGLKHLLIPQVQTPNPPEQNVSTNTAAPGQTPADD